MSEGESKLLPVFVHIDSERGSEIDGLMTNHDH